MFFDLQWGGKVISSSAAGMKVNKTKPNQPKNQVILRALELLCQMKLENRVQPAQTRETIGRKYCYLLKEILCI